MIRLLARCRWGLLLSVVLFSEPVQAELPAAPLSFSREILPILTKAGCNSGACHGSFQGRGGMQLSLLGYDALSDYAVLFKAGRGRRSMIALPEQSLILRKATGAMTHGGGKRFDADSPFYRSLRDYMSAGAPPPTPADSPVIGLEVSYRSVVLQPGEQVTLEAEAIWSDGTRKRITDLALYDSRDDQVAEVTPIGAITARRPGMTPVSVRFSGQVATVVVTIPYHPTLEITDYPVQNVIDEKMAAQWSTLRLQPAPLASDDEFLRRVYLDLIGTLPEPGEVTAFLTSAEPHKRSQVVDQLLERPEYVPYWTLKWGDLLRGHRRFLGDRGLASFTSWLRQAVRENRPLDQFAKELLTSQGNLFTNGAVAYYYVDATPEELAETTAQLFLGVRLQCAKCHHHPLEVWSQDDYYGLAAFFLRLEKKDNLEEGRFGGARLLKVSRSIPPGRRLGMEADPHVLGGSLTALEGVADPRKVLADWIVDRQNPWFARNFANRYWYYLMGRGIVEPVDDQRATNPPSNPELLDALANEFIDHGYDVKHLLRTICNSRTYQLASNFSPEQDRDGVFFSYRLPRRLPAEVLLDAVDQATGSRETFQGVAPGTRAIALPDPTVRSYFLSAFGRPARNVSCECAREGLPNLSQALHLINGESIHGKIAAPDGRLAKLLGAPDDVNRAPSDDDVIQELYLATLSRSPTDAERRTARNFLSESPSRREGFEDLLWTLINHSHFSFNH